MSEHGPRCETCDSDFHVAENEFGEFICENCEQNAAERAWDRFCDKFYGGSDPLTIREQSIHARRLK